MRRVVVTGVGIVSPLGSSVNTAWRALLAGQCGLGPITRFDPSAYPVQIGGHVRGFDFDACSPSRVLDRADPLTQYGFGAAAQAIKDAGIEIDERLSQRSGVCIGAFAPGLVHVEGQGREFFDGVAMPRVRPSYFVASSINSAATSISVHYGIAGPSITSASSCAAGAQAIALAARLIQTGDADLMVAGGTAVNVAPYWLALLSAVGWLSQRNGEPQRASRPWDESADGVVLADGAAALVLEEEGSARARGAQIYAHVAGIGMCSDAYDYARPSPFGQGCEDAMRAALSDACLAVDQIQCIAASSSSNRALDSAESIAISRLFGSQKMGVAVTSTKGGTGYLGAASGALNAAFAVLALRDGVVPPTINLEMPASQCAELDYVRESRDTRLQAVMSNSYGLGGTNTTLVFRRNLA